MAHYLVISGEGNWAWSVEMDANATYRIGRAEDNDIVLKDPRVSSYHARLTGEGGKFSVTDLESRNGIWFNASRVRSHKISENDRITIGKSELQYVTRLDSTALSGAAILSPRLSQPLLKTELQKLQAITTDLVSMRDSVGGKSLSDQDISKLGERLTGLVTRMSDIEDHMRLLIITNHFHELFHKPRPMGELFQECTRFIAAAVESENAALFMVDGSGPEDPLRIEARQGLSVATWSNRIPPKFELLVRQALRENRSSYIRSMQSDPRFSDGGTGDGRSILVAPVRTAGGTIIGVAYFDNVTRPPRLTEAAARLAEGCLGILGDFLAKERQGDTAGGKSDRSTMAVVPPSPPATMMVDTENRTMF